MNVAASLFNAQSHTTLSDMRHKSRRGGGLICIYQALEANKRHKAVVFSQKRTTA